MAQCYDDYDEVSISREDALRMARLFRSMGEDNWADLLDPPDPPPTLRDEVASAIAFMRQDAEIFPKPTEEDYEAATTAMGVIQEKIELLPVDGYPRAVDEYRADVLKLFGSF